jgi:DNA repair photolyase
MTLSLLILYFIEKLDFDIFENLESPVKLNRTIQSLELRVQKNIEESASILQKSLLAPEISERLRSRKAINENYNDFVQNIEI